MIKPVAQKTEKIRKSSAEKLRRMPITRVLPNIITLMAMCTGVSAIRFALNDKLELAVVAILIAAILDFMDGRIARLLDSSSHFGAELDSLSDFICFGVSPAVVMYYVSLHQWNGIGWSIALFFVICSALRLARFNTDSLKAEEKPAWMKKFFTGVPSTAGGIMAIMGLVFSFAVEIPLYTYPAFCAPFLLVAGVLMVSRIPMFSMKGTSIHPRQVLYLMLGIGVFVTCLINAFWITLSVFGIAYISTIPFSIRA
ncbi:MAG: CDP-diacylglycerol--serine O-phosphatidyltransferase, partial [Alphaproteobacteria bacterium]